MPKDNAVSPQGMELREGRRIEWRFLQVALFSLCLGLVAGCSNDSEDAAHRAVALYHQGSFDQARLILEPQSKKTDGDFVLNNERLGSTALAEYRLDEAEDAFLRAYEVINSVGVNDGGRSLGASLVQEDIKVWKGEPFERAMANFYLGTVYYMRHDYNNARAAFENAVFKLKDYTDTGDKDKFTEVESDFTLGYLMLGRCWQRLGEPDKAQNYFDKVKTLRPDLAALADAQTQADSNVLLIVDWGNGPRKITKFDGSVVGFGPPPEQAGPIFTPRIIVDGVPFPIEELTRPPVDTLALAQEKTWQSIDTIRLIKSVAGEGLVAAGAVEASQGHRQNTELGIGLIAAGLLLKASSAPDLRQWEMVPRAIFPIPLHLAPGPHDITIECAGSYQTWQGIVAPDTGDAAYYFHMSRATSGTFRWPPPALAPPAPAPPALAPPAPQEPITLPPNPPAPDSAAPVTPPAAISPVDPAASPSTQPD